MISLQVDPRFKAVFMADLEHVSVAHCKFGLSVGDVIPIADAEEMLSSLCKLPAIDKTRYIVPFEGNIWEVDEFHGQLQGLILAEIEIPAPDYSYKIPQFIGQNVTDDARFYNSNLASATLADLNLNS